MEIKDVQLVNLEGNSVVTSVNFADRKDCCEYFGTWYKKDCTHSDVVSWCDKQIKEYTVFIQNLKSLKEISREAMIGDMGLDELKALVARLEGNN